MRHPGWLVPTVAITEIPMPSRRADSETHSMLTRALRRLDQVEQRLGGNVEESERRLADWEERWQARQSSVVRRLQVIDGQLAVLTGNFDARGAGKSPAAGTPPMLGVVGAPVDASSMSSMVAN